MTSSSSTSEMPSTSRSTLIRAIPIGVILVFLFSIAGGLLFAADRQARFDGRIYPGVFIQTIPVGGLTQEEARAKINNLLSQSQENGLSFQVGTSTLTARSEQLREWIRPNEEDVLRQAYQTGRDSRPAHALVRVLGLSLHEKNLSLSSTIDQEAVRSWLETQSASILPSAHNARLVIDTPTATTSAVRIEPEQRGQTIQIEPAIQEFQRQAEALQFHPIQLTLQTLEPAIRASDLQTLQREATDWLGHAPFVVSYEQRSWNVSPAMLASWITATTTPSLRIALDRSKITQDLTPWLGENIRVAKDGILEFNEDKTIKTFVAPIEGVMIDAEATTANIEHVLNASSSTAPIALARQTPRILGTEAETMGIQEVIGVGTSNFSGSPSNRRKNIALGAKHVNGSLVAPDAEFSLLKTLGPIDGAHGWFPELVIKGNKTTPEFGGGLCQIGTTVFRAAMNSGLIITERRNHSYRVRYYEPAGTDATIYDPAPDFRFKNDTGHWVLVTTDMRGDNLVFTVWGTKDGRTVAPLKPIISNIVPPPPKKLIPTTDLAPGQTKCTEVAHAGATARLDYVVTYASGDVKKTTFTSYYKPWGAVCLVGSTTATTPATGVDETGINNPN